MRRILSFGPAAVVLATAVAVLVLTPMAVRGVVAADTSARITLARQAMGDDDILERLNRATIALGEATLPSVVHIEVVPSGQRRWRARSSGTGWVFNDDGYIVTNAHVVRGAERISVQFSDGRLVDIEEIRGESFLADPFSDIAVIKVPAGEHVRPMPRATGMLPQQGERVFAFGSPFGFKFSMSEGIIGGVGRNPQTAADFGGYTNYIQHDAAVNPGNSGGPLVDIKGRVIGMNVAIATGRDSQGTTGEGQSSGISFAIPLATIESVVSQLIEEGKVARGFMGIRWAGGDEAIVFEESIRATGIRVASVEIDQPAARAGMLGGDIITRIGGTPVTNFAVLRSVITSARPGTVLKVEAYRNGQKRDFEVTLMEMPVRNLVNNAAVWNEFVRFGLVVRDSEMGPRVQRVGEGTRAEEAGFAEGMTVLAVEGKAVKTFEDVQVEAVENGLLVGRRVTLTVSATDERGASEPREIDIFLVRERRDE